MLAAALYLLGAADRQLHPPDEIRVAGIACEMAQGGSWAIPTLHGEPFLEKPPLGYLGISLSLQAFGRSAFTARLPSLLWGLIGAGALGLLARDVYGTRAAGFVAGLVLLFTPYAFDVNHRCLVDPPLAAAVVLTVLCLRRTIDRPEQRARWALATVAAAALAFFAKGVVGLVFPGLALVGLLAARRDPALLRSGWLWAAPLLVVLCILPWPAALYQEGGTPALRTAFIDNLLHRVQPVEGYTGGHQQPWYYYLDRVWSVLLPHSLLLPAALVWHRRRPLGQRADALWLLAAWLGGGLLVLSLAGTKRTLYLLPLLPPACLVSGGWLASLLDSEREWHPVETWTVRAMAGAAALGAFGAPLVLAILYGLSPVLVVTWVAGTLLGVGACLALRRQEVRRTLLLALASGLLAWVGGLLSAGPGRDAEHDLSELFVRVDRLVPRERRLLLLGPSEATLGALSFYVGRRGEVVSDAEATRAALDGDEPLYVLLVERVREGRPTKNLQVFADLDERALVRYDSGREAGRLFASRGALAASPPALAPERTQ